MKIGQLRHKVQIQTPKETQDNLGGTVTIWESFSDAFAEIKPISGKEYMAQSGLNSEISHQITMRFIPGMTSTMRIIFGERIFTIESVINLYETNRVLQLMVKENV